MGSWIRLCIISVALFGCKSSNEIFFQKNQSFEMTNEVKFSPYAMQLISTNNEKEQLFLLNSVNQPLFKWSNSNKVKIHNPHHLL